MKEMIKIQFISRETVTFPVQTLGNIFLYHAVVHCASIHLIIVDSLKGLSHQLNLFLNLILMALYDALVLTPWNFHLFLQKLNFHSQFFFSTFLISILLCNVILIYCGIAHCILMVFIIQHFRNADFIPITWGLYDM